MTILTWEHCGSCLAGWVTPTFQAHAVCKLLLPVVFQHEAIIVALHKEHDLTDSRSRCRPEVQRHVGFPRKTGHTKIAQSISCTRHRQQRGRWRLGSWSNRLRIDGPLRIRMKMAAVIKRDSWISFRFSQI